MKAEELRIGNYVKYYGERYIITAIYSYGFLEIYRFGIYKKVDRIEVLPFVLTEDWLLKFDKIKWLRKDKGGYFYWFEGEKKYIKYVHTLQNTYFCIEKKELI